MRDHLHAAATSRARSKAGRCGDIGIGPPAERVQYSLSRLISLGVVIINWGLSPIAKARSHDRPVDLVHVVA